jgi:hypothetical protein
MFKTHLKSLVPMYYATSASNVGLVSFFEEGLRVSALGTMFVNTPFIIVGSTPFVYGSALFFVVGFD